MLTNFEIERGKFYDALKASEKTNQNHINHLTAEVKEANNGHALIVKSIDNMGDRIVGAINAQSELTPYFSPISLADMP